MRAFVQNGYGSADAYELVDIAKPVPSEDEVLVRIIASAVNDWEWGLLKAPWPMRLVLGLRRPGGRYHVMGCDIAGRVEAVGIKVGAFAPGDEVYGDLSGYRFGGFAEYACASVRHLHRKPATVSFEQAAALPHAAELALQAIRAAPKLRPGQEVLINGAAGGVGTLAVQAVMLKPNRNLAEISEIVESGALKPVLDQVFAFADLPQALTRFREAVHVGKIVIRMPDQAE